MPSRLRTRTGYTLIEMVTVIALLGLVMSLTGGLLVLAMKSDRQLGQGINETRTVVQLSEQLRADGHSTPVSGLVVQADQKLVLQPESARSIEYHRGLQGLERVETGADGSRIRRDLFRLPAAAEVVWNFEESTGLLRLQIRLPEVSELHAKGERQSGRSWPEVIVWVGKLARVQQAADVSESTGGPS